MVADPAASSGERVRTLIVGNCPPTRHLHHVNFPVDISGIEGFNGQSYQEIALSGVANALASRRVAQAINLMQRVRHVIGQHCKSMMRNSLN